MSLPRAVRLVAVSLLALLIAACASTVPEARRQPALAQAPKDFAAGFYEQAAARGKVVYRVDPAASLVTITVRRAGSLAHLGHDHVVASRSVQGYVAPDEGRADLYVPLADLTVDEPALRAEAALNTQPTESDIAGTRSNMLDKVLQVQEFPFALVHVSGVEAKPAASNAQAAVAITLHGTTRTMNTSLHLASTPGELSAAGTIEFNQSDFGIVALSILGGAIQVKDQVSLHFAIRARSGGREEVSLLAPLAIRDAAP
jgi:polyisoprenoid-binding protein YceI